MRNNPYYSKKRFLTKLQNKNKNKKIKNHQLTVVNNSNP